MKLTYYQNEKVKELITCINKSNDSIWFQAPTGSGKTYILANVINNILLEQKQKNQKIIFIVSSLSQGAIHEQNYIKFNKYKNINTNLKYETWLINSPSKTKKTKLDLEYIIPKINNCIYCIGTSSARSKTLLVEQNYLDDLIKILIHENYLIYYIRDEAHIGTKAPKNNTLDSIIQQYANKKIYLTATPGKDQKIDVKMTIAEAEEDGLIKSKRVQNNLETIEDYDEVTNTELLKAVFKKFKKIKTNYLKNFNINPALLIQIGSKNQLTPGIESIITKLLDENKLSYAIWTNEKKYSSQNIFENNITKSELQNELTKNNSAHDVVIFKVALAIGWDIPRACILLQLRDISSEQLNEQTIGRIRRNPLKNLEQNEISNKYYIYSNYNSDKKGENIVLTLKNNDKFLNQTFRKYVFKEKAKITDEITDKVFIEKCDEYFYKLNDDILNDVKKYKNKNFSWTITNFKLIDSETSKIFNYVIKFNNQFDIYNFWSQNISTRLLKPLNTFIYKYAKKIAIAKHLLMFYILKTGFEKISMLYSHSLSESVKNEFSLIYNKLPKKSYVSINKEYNVGIDKIGYEKIYNSWPYNQYENIEKTKESYPQESNSEKVFLKEFIINNKDKNFEIITKNYVVNSDINLEYLKNIEDNDGEKKMIFCKKSIMYPDYIIKYNNKIYYIEIKSLTRDYDVEKTKSIKKYYELFANHKTNKNQKYIYILAKINVNNWYKGQKWLNAMKYSYQKRKEIKDINNILD